MTVASRILASIQGRVSPQDPGQYFRTDHLTDDLKGRTVRGGTLVVGTQAAVQVIGVLATILLARVLTPADYGLLAMVIAITGVIGLFRDLGLSAVTIQLPVVNQQQISALFWINTALGCVLALVTVALAPLIAWFYGEPRLMAMTMVLSSGFVLGGLCVQHRALLRRQMRYSTLSRIEIATGIIRAITGVIAALSGLGYWSLVLMSVVGGPVQLVLLWVYCAWFPSRPARAEGVRKMISFGSNLTGYQILQYLVRNMDNLLIGRVFGAASLGLYTKAYSLLVLPLRLINVPVANVAIPTLSRLTDDPERYRRAYAIMVANVCLITVPLAAYMVGTADWIILTLLGPQWTEASAIFAWLGVSGLVEPFSFTTIWLFVSQDRTRQQFRWGLISATLIITAFIVGLSWGPIGVAAAYALVNVFVRVPLLLWYVGREGPVRTRDLINSLFPFICIACAVLPAIYLYRTLAPVNSAIIGLISAVLITAMLTFGVLAILPSGRPILRELRTVPNTLLHRETPE